jgi:hypothetical protein
MIAATRLSMASTAASYGTGEELVSHSTAARGGVSTERAAELAKATSGNANKAQA